MLDQWHRRRCWTCAGLDVQELGLRCLVGEYPSEYRVELLESNVVVLDIRVQSLDVFASRDGRSYRMAGSFRAQQ